MLIWKGNELLPLPRTEKSKPLPQNQTLLVPCGLKPTFAFANWKAKEGQRLLKEKATGDAKDEKEEKKQNKRIE